MNDTDQVELLSILEGKSPAELRRRWFEVPESKNPPNSAYSYQITALERIEVGERQGPYASGILYFPTGAGKTRVGVELMSRALRGNPNQRFLWATHSKELIRQSMVRLVELCALFPAGIRFSWCENEEELIEEPEDPFHIMFLTRDTLRRALERAGHQRRRHSWKDLLHAGVPVTLIYDECHQLGAPELQRQWKKFHESVVVGARGKRRPWRTIGLSATPIPTSDQARQFLERYVFPRNEAVRGTLPGWNMHVFFKVTTEALQGLGILCKVNTYYDDLGTFNIPDRILARLLGGAKIAEPGSRASRDELAKYAMVFNKAVMSSPEVVTFLAEKLGEQLQNLGKTIVFVPQIEAANRFVAVLHDRFPALRGKVGVVHSRMQEAVVPGQSEHTPQEVIAKFKAFGQSPCILVNVDMLTEGFDDPGVRTVVLARLTLSTNRFWQMIGRGTRGPACKGGTDYCNVIDPIKLVRLYRYFDGYQPSLTDPTHVAAEDDPEDRAQGALSPAVGTICRAPGPETARYRIDPEIERIRGSVADALRAFISGAQLSEAQALEIARGVTLVPEGDGIVAKARPEAAFDEGVSQTLLRTQLAQLQQSLGVDLPFLSALADHVTTSEGLQHCLRVMRAVQTLGIRSHEQFLRAQMDAAFLKLLQAPAPAVPEPAQPAKKEQPAAFDDRARALGSLAMTVASVDGHVADVEIDAALELIRIVCSVPPTAEVRSALTSMKRMELSEAVPFTADLSHATRYAIMTSLVNVAAADGVLDPAEVKLLEKLTAALDVPRVALDGLIGSARGGAARRNEPDWKDICRGCSQLLPPGARFCSWCGASQ